MKPPPRLYSSLLETSPLLHSSVRTWPPDLQDSSYARCGPESGHREVQILWGAHAGVTRDRGGDHRLDGEVAVATLS